MKSDNFKGSYREKSKYNIAITMLEKLLFGCTNNIFANCTDFE